MNQTLAFDRAGLTVSIIFTGPSGGCGANQVIHRSLPTGGGKVPGAGEAGEKNSSANRARDCSSDRATNGRDIRWTIRLWLAAGRLRFRSGCHAAGGAHHCTSGATVIVIGFIPKPMRTTGRHPPPGPSLIRRKSGPRSCRKPDGLTPCAGRIVTGGANGVIRKNRVCPG